MHSEVLECFKLLSLICICKLPARGFVGLLTRKELHQKFPKGGLLYKIYVENIHIGV